MVSMRLKRLQSKLFEALGKFLPDVDRPNAGVFAWQGRGRGMDGACAMNLTCAAGACLCAEPTVSTYALPSLCSWPCLAQ